MKILVGGFQAEDLVRSDRVVEVLVFGDRPVGGFDGEFAAVQVPELDAV